MKFTIEKLGNLVILNSDKINSKWKEEYLDIYEDIDYYQKVKKAQFQDIVIKMLFHVIALLCKLLYK